MAPPGRSGRGPTPQPHAIDPQSPRGQAAIADARLRFGFDVTSVLPPDGWAVIETADGQAFAAVCDDDGRILLVRRIDTGNRELPGGRVELGESATEAVEREVAEESGVMIKTAGLVGVYSDPGHVMMYPKTGEVGPSAVRGVLPRGARGRPPSARSR